MQKNLSLFKNQVSLEELLPSCSLYKRHARVNHKSRKLHASSYPRLVQCVLDVGQNIGIKTCTVCGMQYNVGNAEDTETHRKFHDIYQNGARFCHFKDIKEIRSVSHGGRIVIIFRSNYITHELDEVIRVVNEDLGYIPNVEPADTSVYLYLDPSSHVHGYLEVEEVHPSRIFSFPEDQVTLSALPARSNLFSAAVLSSSNTCVSTSSNTCNSTTSNTRISTSLQPRKKRKKNPPFFKQASLLSYFSKNVSSSLPCSALANVCTSSPASSANLSASSANLSANSADLSASSANLSASSAYLSANSANLSANSADLSANSADLSASSVDLSANSADLSASSANLSASSADLSASSADLSASSANSSQAFNSPLKRKQPHSSHAADFFPIFSHQNKKPNIPAISTADNSSNACECIDPAWQISNTIKLGIRKIWTHKTHRRQGICAQLLDVARERFRFPFHYFERHECAFSDPTPLGILFAKNYLKGCRFYLYRMDIRSLANDEM